MAGTVDGGLKTVRVRLVDGPPIGGGKEVHGPEDAVNIVRDEITWYDREVLCALNLSTMNQVMG